MRMGRQAGRHVAIGSKVWLRYECRVMNLLSGLVQRAAVMPESPCGTGCAALWTDGSLGRGLLSTWMDLACPTPCPATAIDSPMALKGVGH
jgi:hypothetical protein